ncbi:hypothetical protein [Lactobacillus intestinalis]|uniref:hypothetical protein n=1 Tax=Lactobacillus intestinalis TaxID=151781 RepID=UPI00242AD5C8|nr:hypothetical protein [Lactobacillus intestinalis]
MLGIAIIPTFSTYVNAASIGTTTINQNTKVSLSVQEKLDKYVTVNNNQYVLSKESKSIVSEQEYAAAQQLIKQTNEAIKKTDSVINRETKVATNEFTLSDDKVKVISLNQGKATKRKKYHYGVNKVTYHWNYIRVYLNKNMTQTIASGALGGLGSLIASYVSGGAATFAVGAITAAVTTFVGNSIKGGVWVDYNFLAKTVTRTGWQ